MVDKSHLLNIDHKPATQKFLYYVLHAKYFLEQRDVILEMKENKHEDIEKVARYYEIPDHAHAFFVKMIHDEQAFENNNTVEPINEGCKKGAITGPAVVITLYNYTTKKEFERLWPEVLDAQTGKLNGHCFGDLFDGDELKGIFDFDIIWECYKQRRDDPKLTYKELKKNLGIGSHMTDNNLGKRVNRLTKVIEEMQKES